MRFFNTAGPCDPRFHYMLPAAERLPEGPRLVAQGAYFVVHAPRQTGKTTTLAALAAQLTAAGQHAALLVSCEVGQSLGEDLVAVQRATLRSIRQEAELVLPPELQPPDPWPAHDEGLLLPLMASSLEGGDSYDDDFAYVRDLGLIAPQPPTRPANPIYQQAHPPAGRAAEILRA